MMINLVCYYVHIPGLMFLEWHPFRMRLADKSDLFLEMVSFVFDIVDVLLTLLKFFRCEIFVVFSVLLDQLLLRII